MLRGGFHTPNHRWVMASALSLLYRLYGDERFRREAELYLAEGIDCTPEGEYTERSVGIYNVVNNRSLMIMAEELGRPELLEHVRRNLAMVQSYLEPDGSLYTLASRRQDLGTASFPVPYYENYLLLAHAEGNPVHAGMAELLLRQAEDRKGGGERIDRVLTQYLLRPELRERDLERRPPPDRYELWNPGSGVARFRRGSVSLGLLRDSGAFLKLQVGALEVKLRVAATFYGPRGPFRPTSIERRGDRIALASRDRWGYVRPFGEPPPTSEWEAMPHARRERANMQDHDVEALCRWTGEGVELELHSRGIEGVLYKLELILSPGGWLDTPDLSLPGTAGQWALLRAARATYAFHSDRIEILGGFAEHSYGPRMRGSEPQDMGSFTLASTGYTPMDRRLTIRAL